ASVVITPLALLGGVFYSARSLGNPWSTLTRIDPLYYLVDTTRAGLTGLPRESRLALARRRRLRRRSCARGGCHARRPRLAPEALNRNKARRAADYLYVK